MLPRELNGRGGWLGGGEKELLVHGRTMNALLLEYIDEKFLDKLVNYGWGRSGRCTFPRGK